MAWIRPSAYGTPPPSAGHYSPTSPPPFPLSAQVHYCHTPRPHIPLPRAPIRCQAHGADYRTLRCTLLCPDNFCHCLPPDFHWHWFVRLCRSTRCAFVMDRSGTYDVLPPPCLRFAPVYCAITADITGIYACHVYRITRTPPYPHSLPPRLWPPFSHLFNMRCPCVILTVSTFLSFFVASRAVLRTYLACHLFATATMLRLLLT